MMSTVFPTRSGGSGDPLTSSSIWQALERLLDSLRSGEPASLLIRRVLRDVRDSVDADVAYFFPGLSGEAFALDGTPALPAAWCQQFTLRTLGSSPGVDRELVRSHLPPLEHGGHEAQPHSVAMVRLSRTHSSWLAVLSFRP